MRRVTTTRATHNPGQHAESLAQPPITARESPPTRPKTPEIPMTLTLRYRTLKAWTHDPHAQEGRKRLTYGRFGLSVRPPTAESAKPAKGTSSGGGSAGANLFSTGG